MQKWLHEKLIYSGFPSKDMTTEMKEQYCQEINQRYNFTTTIEDYEENLPRRFLAKIMLKARK